MAWWRRPSPETVVREHGPAVHRHLLRIFGPRADVDDVFQNVFVEILRSLPGFQGKAQLSTWIRRITWNVAYQEMRLSYRRPQVATLDEAHLLAEPEGAETAAARRQAIGRLYQRLERLEPKLRMALVLHDIEGCTLKEVGEILGRPLQTVASQVRAARARLAQSDEPQGGGAKAQKGEGMP